MTDPKFNHYGVIYADPPWRFVTYSKKGLGRSAEAHYDTMSFDELCSLPVARWAKPDAVLLLWITDPMLPKGLELMSAWGFTYKTVGFYWAKLNKRAPPGMFSELDFFTGMGYWTRANCEQCLLGTIGKPERLSKGVRRLHISNLREHSRKPEQVPMLIEALTPGPYLEMFGRETRENWDSWGNQTGLFDDGSVETRRLGSSLVVPQVPKKTTLTLEDLK